MRSHSYSTSYMLKKFESSGILYTEATFDNIDDMLDAKRDFEETMSDNKDNVGDLVVTSRLNIGKEYSFIVEAYKKYLLN